MKNQIVVNKVVTGTLTLIATGLFAYLIYLIKDEGNPMTKGDKLTRDLDITYFNGEKEYACITSETLPTLTEKGAITYIDTNHIRVVFRANVRFLELIENE